MCDLQKFTSGLANAELFLDNLYLNICSANHGRGIDAVLTM